MRKNIIIILVLITSVMLTACSSNIGKIENGYTNYGNLKSEQFRRPEIGEEIAVITTNKGIIKVRLLEENAPIYVERFKQLIKEGVYNGTKFARGRIDAYITLHDEEFHEKYRLPDDYQMENLKDYHAVTGTLNSIKVRGEFSSLFAIFSNREVDELDIDRMEDLSDEYGYTRDVIKAYKKLGGRPEAEYLYTIFGQVFYGMDIVFEINKMETELVEDRYNMYVEDIIIEKIELVPYQGDI